MPLQLQIVHLYVGDHEVYSQNCAMHPVAHPMLHTLVRTSRSYAIDTANSSQHRFLASTQPGCLVVGQYDTPGQETCASMHACMAEYNAKRQLTIACRVALKACLHNLAFLIAVAIASHRMFTHGLGQMWN